MTSADGLWDQFDVLLQHDKGQVTLRTAAPDLDSLVRTVMATERCPERAILRITRVKARPLRAPSRP